MKIILKSPVDVIKEDAHSGSGSKKLYIDDKASPGERIQGFTHGWLPAGQSFDWHNHIDIEEVMYVMKGTGIVSDKDGGYRYTPGTVCVFPAGIMHKISNDTEEEHEFIFIRVYN